MNPSSTATPDSSSDVASEWRWFTTAAGESWRVFRVQPTTGGAADSADWLTFSRDGDKRPLAPAPSIAESMVHVRRLLIKLGLAPASPEFLAAARVFLDAYYASSPAEPAG